MFFCSRQNVVRLELHTMDQKKLHTLLSTFFPAIGSTYVLLIPLSVGVFPIFELVQQIYFLENCS
jgi:hypothetical protein